MSSPAAILAALLRALIAMLCSALRLLADDRLNGRIGLPASRGEADNRTAAP